MTDIIETDEETGLTLKIEQDPDVERPYSHDGSVILAVLHRQYINPAEKFAGADLTTVEGIAEFEAANAAARSPWVVIPLFLYDHSGTSYRAGYSNPFSCPWDSGRVGVIALWRADFDQPKRGALKGEAWQQYKRAHWLKAANACCDEYTAWANGDCWGYVIEDEDGDDTGDSCWGFIGREYAEEQAREAFAEALKAARADLAANQQAERPDLYAGA